MTGLVLAAIVAANLILDFALFYAADASDGFLRNLFFVAVGAALSQILLLALWFACLEGGWVERFVVPVALTGFIGCTAAPALSVEPLAVVIASIAFQFPLFALVAVLWPFCRLRGWRLTLQAARDPGQRGQFRIGDLLAWTTTIALLLALSRLWFTPGSTPGPGIKPLLAFVVLPLPVLWTVLLASFSFWRGPNWQLAIQASALLLYSAAAATVCCRLLYAMWIWLPGPPGSVLLPQCVSATALCFIGVPLILSLNCLVLRSRGWRLARPLEMY